jgi:predicted DNA-binding protein (MmcQ/YjbR family)
MPSAKHTAVEKRLLKVALAYPEAAEEFPWGERVIKVRGKIFVFINVVDGALSVTTKLPHTSEMALLLPFAKPTGYGLGKAGWVSARFAAKDAVPEDMLRAWIDESYRAVAPKRLVKSLDGP